MLLAAVGSLLLIGCANLGHLLLVRALSRERDYALRAALGAGRGALVRGAFAEVVLLAGAGGFLGLLLAYWGMRAFVALLPSSLYIPRFDVVALDWRLLAVSAAASIGATAGFGLLPALRVVRPDLNPLLKSAARAERRSRSVFRRPGSILLVSEVCLTLVLLTATVCSRSFRALLEANARFRPERLLTLDLSFSNAAVRTLPDFQKAKVGLLTELEQRIAPMRGVRVIAAAESFPLSANTESFRLDGETGRVASALPEAELHVVTPNFFQTMASSVMLGRLFTDSDGAGARPVAVINEAMARRYWPGGSCRTADRVAPLHRQVGLLPDRRRREGTGPAGEGRRRPAGSLPISVAGANQSPVVDRARLRRSSIARKNAASCGAADFPWLHDGE